MHPIDEHLDRIAAAVTRTSWRCELGTVDPALLARAERAVGPLPDEARAFLSRVVVLENHAGDVAFVTARDLADPDAPVARALDEWRRSEECSTHTEPAALAEVQAFWNGALPLVCSTVHGDDFLALDRRAEGAPVIQAWGERGWSESARPCARGLGDFLAALADVFETGPSAFECGWRLSRKTLAAMQARHPGWSESLVPLVFATDFDTAVAPRRATRPLLAVRG